MRSPTERLLRRILELPPEVLPAGPIDENRSSETNRYNQYNR